MSEHIPDKSHWAVIVPLSNESGTIGELAGVLREVMTQVGDGVVYFVIDRSSKDSTLADATRISEKDPRFQVLWRPDVSNVVEAYLEGFKHAVEKKHSIIIEMDGGMSHDPRAIPFFLSEFDSNTDCVFGSRFRTGGKLVNKNKIRVFLSKGGTFLANFLLGTSMTDMTSGYQAFRSDVVEALLKYPLKSTGHFYQTEVRYLLSDLSIKEVAIKYKGDGKNVGVASLKNAFSTLWYYFVQKMLSRPCLIQVVGRGQSGAI